MVNFPELCYNTENQIIKLPYRILLATKPGYAGEPAPTQEHKAP